MRHVEHMGNKPPLTAHLHPHTPTLSGPSFAHHPLGSCTCPGRSHQHLHPGAERALARASPTQLTYWPLPTSPLLTPHWASTFPHRCISLVSCLDMFPSPFWVGLLFQVDVPGSQKGSSNSPLPPEEPNPCRGTVELCPLLRAQTGLGAGEEQDDKVPWEQRLG